MIAVGCAGGAAKQDLVHTVLFYGHLVSAPPVGADRTSDEACLPPDRASRAGTQKDDAAPPLCETKTGQLTFSETMEENKSWQRSRTLRAGDCIRTLTTPQGTGDLTELAASIKENGIFQNLTVIPGHYLNSREYIAKCVDEGGDAAAAAAAWTPKAVWSSDDYTIIIGHRRAAAAQQAGLFEVPCVVVEMDEREQLQTMMIENMQRSDLTTYEQAQGFQLMLDLGDTVEQVASKSGFSQSTIRRRVKLLSLDRDAFRRAELRGATLSDYAELDKIESVEDKNKALEALGTQNFRRVMQEVLENQKWEHRKAEWIADLKKFAIEDPNATYQTHEHVTGYSKWNITKDVVVPEDADHVQYFYKVSSGQIDLYKTRDVAAEDAEKAKRDAAREEERMIGESFHNITELMFNLRREFVVELTPTDCKRASRLLSATWPVPQTIILI